MGTSAERKIDKDIFVIMLAVIIVVFIFGYVVGLTTDLPARMDIVVGMDEETKEVMNNLENKTFVSNCCYPSNCPQAVNNPEQCTCQYMVYCGDANSKITKNIWGCVNESFIHITGISQGEQIDIYKLIENETVDIYFSELFPKGEVYAPSEDYLNVTYETKERCDFKIENDGVYNISNSIYYNFSDAELKDAIIKLKANPGYNVPG